MTLHLRYPENHAQRRTEPPPGEGATPWAWMRWSGWFASGSAGSLKNTSSS